MNPVVKYTFGRIGLFVLVAAPLFLLPIELNVFLKLMIALLVSMVLSYFLLRRWRDEVAERMAVSARRRGADKERLRAALAGEDEEAAPPAEKRKPAKESPEPKDDDDGDRDGDQPTR